MQRTQGLRAARGQAPCLLGDGGKGSGTEDEKNKDDIYTAGTVQYHGPQRDHCVTVSLCPFATVSSCHCVTVLLCHCYCVTVTVSLCHRVTV